jgi:Phage integrase family
MRLQLEPRQIAKGCFAELRQYMAFHHVGDRFPCRAPLFRFLEWEETVGPKPSEFETWIWFRMTILAAFALDDLYKFSFCFPLSHPRFEPKDDGMMGVPKLAPHDLRRSCARLCHTAGGELEQIQFLLGHASVQTTEKYLGCKQRLRGAVNDRIGLEPAQ